MSETCPLLAISIEQPETVRDKEHEIAVRMKAGQCFPLVDLRVVDFDMNDVPQDGVASGEVVVRAPWLTSVYHKNPEATEVLWDGGYLHTQDIGAIDAHGYFQITDRIKDVIKTGGEWVSSIELESIIGHHPAVAEVAVIGLPDPKWGERPVAVVVPRAGATLEATDIKDQVLRQVELGVVSKYAVPQSIFFVEELPKTSVGKLNKKALRASLSTVTAQTTAAAPAQTS
jgi:fatty-acyl-CoA synthase